MRLRAGVRPVAVLAAAALFAGCWRADEAGSSDGAAAGDGSGRPGPADETGIVPPTIHIPVRDAAAASQS